MGESHVGMPPFRTPTNLDDMASHLDDLSTNKIYISRHISQSLSPLATRHTQMWVEIHLQVTFICSHRAHDYIYQQLIRDRYIYSPSAPFMHILHQLFFFEEFEIFHSWHNLLIWIYTLRYPATHGRGRYCEMCPHSMSCVWPNYSQWRQMWKVLHFIVILLATIQHTHMWLVVLSLSLLLLF